MQTNRKLTLLVFAVIIVVLGGAFILWLRAPKGYSGKMESIVVGIQTNESASEVYVAHKLFFPQNGINLTIKSYDGGAVAVNGMLLDEVNLAGAAEMPLVSKAFEHKAISTIACANKLDYMCLIARRDRGIESISDLAKRKRIGVPLRTIAEFYLSRFFELHGMSTDKVTIINTAFSQSEGALTNGTVDAVVTCQPYVTSLKNQLGTNSVTWEVQSNQLLFGMFIGKNEWIANHPELIKRFLKAIDQANNFITSHPAEAKSIVKNRLNYTDEYLKIVWPENNFSLSLDQALIAAMEDEARWMIKNKMTKEKQVPDFVNYIYIDGLKAIKPEAVSIIH